MSADEHNGHNGLATELSECEACLDIYIGHAGDEVAAFDAADRAHFAAIRAGGRS